MNSDHTEQIAVNIVNPSAIAFNNLDSYHRYFGPRFKKLTADKGMGRFLLTIKKYPGLTKKDLFLKIFGPNYTGAQFSETFSFMNMAKVIENHRPGYYITALGSAVLKQHGLI